MKFDIDKAIKEICQRNLEPLNKTQKGYLITIKNLETGYIENTFKTECFIGAAKLDGKIFENIIKTEDGTETDIARTIMSLNDAIDSLQKQLSKDTKYSIKVMHIYNKLISGGLS